MCDRACEHVLFLLHTFFFLFKASCFSRVAQNCGGKTLLFRGAFLFWSSVFDLLLGATVNKVAMAMAGEEAKTYHVIEAYTAV